MKRIKQYFEELQEPCRSQAIANTTKNDLENYATSLENALFQAFIWRNTIEGNKYWENLFRNHRAEQFARDHEEEQRFDAENLNENGE